MDQRDTVSTLTLNLDQAKKVSKVKVRHVWNRLYPKEHLPKILVFVVSKEEFFNFQSKEPRLQGGALKPLKQF